MDRGRTQAEMGFEQVLWEVTKTDPNKSFFLILHLFFLSF